MSLKLSIKYIESSEFEEINLYFRDKNLGMYKTNGRIELFDFSESISSTIKVDDHDSNDGDRKTKRGKSDGEIREEGGQEEGEVMILSNITQESESQKRNDSNFPIVMGRKRSRSFGSYSIRRPQRRRSFSLDDLDEESSQQTLCNLVASMAEIYPDYSFESAKARQFVFQDLSNVMINVNSHLAELCEENPSFLSKLWRSIDYVVDVNRCEIFQYTSNPSDDDPFTDGCLWSFNYFFLNKDTYRLVYFTCSAISNMRWLNAKGKLESLYIDSDEDGDDAIDESPQKASPPTEDNEEGDEDDDDVDLDMMDNDCSDGENDQEWEGVI